MLTHFQPQIPGISSAIQMDLFGICHFLNQQIFNPKFDFLFFFFSPGNEATGCRKRVQHQPNGGIESSTPGAVERTPRFHRTFFQEKMFRNITFGQIQHGWITEYFATLVHRIGNITRRSWTGQSDFSVNHNRSGHTIFNIGKLLRWMQSG